MAKVVLVQASPLTSAGGSPVAVYLAGGGSAGRPYTGYQGITSWRSGIMALPVFTTALGFGQDGFTGGAIPQTASIQFGSTDTNLIKQIAALYWRGARIVVQSGDDENGPPSSWKGEMVGTVADFTVSTSILTLVISDLSGDLAKPIVPDTFGGTGGIDGGSDAVGRVKRRSFGRVFNVEGRLLDSANNIYEFGDPARPISGFPLVKDKGRGASALAGVAWQGSVAATFAFLQGFPVPPGGAAIAPSIACVKWWTQPSGPLTADLYGENGNGYVETCPEIAQAIALDKANIPVGNMVQALAFQSRAAGLHCDDASETAAAALDRLLLPVFLPWCLLPTGVSELRPFTFDSPVEGINSDTVQRLTLFNPIHTRRVGFQKNNRIQSDGEISTVLLASTDVTYVDGTPIEALKPAQVNADVTGANVAAAFTGQGAAATQSSFAYGGSFLTGFGALSPLSSVPFGSTYLTESFGGTSATLANFKTILGQAASIIAQGAFATQNSADWYSQLFGKPYWATNEQDSGGGVMRLNGYSITGPYGFLQDVYPRQLGADTTGSNVAAAIIGQNLFTTAGQLSRDTMFSGNYFSINSFSLGFTVTRQDGSSIVTESLAITQLGVSAGFYGQGGLASKTYAAANDLAGGAVGQATLWGNENLATWNDPNNWGAFCQMELMPDQGQFLIGTVAFCATSTTAGSVRIAIRVRRDDGTIVKGGAGGGGVLYAISNGGTSVSLGFVDSVNAGRDTTWYIEVKIADGTNNNVNIEGCEAHVLELGKSHLQHVTITAPNGQGAGAGSGGGGNINGGGGGGFACPEVGEMILLANDAGDGPGRQIPVGSARVG